jgi:hypothetical protein
VVSQPSCSVFQRDMVEAIYWHKQAAAVHHHLAAYTLCKLDVCYMA